MEAGKPKKKIELQHYDLELDKKKTVFTLHIDPKLLQDMKIMCISYKIKYNQFIEEAIREKMLREEP